MAVREGMVTRALAAMSREIAANRKASVRKGINKRHGKGNYKGCRG